MITVDDAKKIMEMVDKFNFSHFKFKQGDSEIVMYKERALDEVKVKEVPPEKEVTENGIETTAKNKEKCYIKSSLAGNFYLKKEENAEPFVKLHDRVEESTVVGLIEVMKLFNEVQAGSSGEIVDILIEDGDFVEYGQPLFEVKESED